MRANLKDGKLIPPRNLERGRLRLKQLRHELKKISREIVDQTGNATREWLEKARRNEKLLRDETEQLIQWIERHESEVLS